MPAFGPIKRKDLLQYLRQLDFEGSYSGGRHQFMVKGQLRLFIPNPHEGDISRSLLARLLREAGIERDEWEKL
jgi:predicted RNA binding protein YcfA (HicA-like mRNA interferase family)